MSGPVSVCPRVSVEGKFFRLGAHKFYAKGVAYGPLVPNGKGEVFAAPEQTARDFAQVRELGANLLRVYHVPPRWFLDIAAEHELKLLIDVPWAKHLCFLEMAGVREAARAAVRQAAQAVAGHPAIFALSVVNEIPSDIVRWSGAGAVADFIDELVGLVKAVDRELLCTFGNYPPTEYLRPKEIDFHCFNVYLHCRRPFENYLVRLQMIADPKPLILGEFGIDSLREGEMRQSHVLSWQIESVFRHGLAGAVVYSFTDEWYKGGRELVEWGFGLTTRERRPKTAFAAVQKGFSEAPCFPLTRYPLISVVVACYNGGPTVRTCLDSLQRLNYPAYEVILVDDGSTDDTAQIAADFKNVRLVQHTANLGLSEARNSGIAAAQGEIIAFIDADCRANSDWLYYLAGGLLSGEFAGIGGPNLLPPDDSCVAAVVMVSPGGPAHVMHSDRVAEHVPGCNMAFYKWVLKEIGGFDPVFRRAGDDVDLCWRLQQRGYTLGFSPAGFVWHYRRSTVCAYLRQQHGYGEAEALLASKHPEHFSGFGGGIWRGRIYSAARFGLVFRRPRIYHGRFGSGFFQSLYRVQPEAALMLFTSLEYQALVTLPLCVLAMAFEFLIVPALVSLLIPVTVCAAAAIQAELPRKKRRFWSRPLVACMFFLQPLVRGWARYGSRLSLRARSLAEYETLDSLSRKRQKLVPDQMQYWGDKGVDRLAFLACAMRRLELQGWPGRSDAGWHNYDLEIAGNLWSRLQLTTVAEAHGGGKYLIRCRLRRAWTFLARVVFCGVLGAELLAVGFWDYAIVWHWLMLLSLAGLAWWLRHQGRNLQRLIGVFLDEVAQQLQLTKIEPCPRKDSTGPGDDNHC